MENLNGKNQISFPTFTKFITRGFDILDKFPALTGQSLFYFSLIFSNIILLTSTGITELSDAPIFFSVPFFGHFYSIFWLRPNVFTFLFLAVVFFTSVVLNKTVLVFFPRTHSSKAKLLLTAFIVGMLSFWPANVLGIAIVQSLLPI